MKKIVSPHLGIYKPQVSSMFSIMQRISGVFLYMGLTMIAWLLICYFCSALMMMKEGVEGETLLFQPAVVKFLSWNILGRILVFGWMLSFYYHACNGIKYLVMDITLKGFGKKSIDTNAFIVSLVAVFLSILSFVYLY